MSRLLFQRKPMPILADYRPLYKITQVLLILYLCSRGKKSSLISWALKEPRRKNIFIESANKNKVHFGIWGVDPSMNFLLQYSIAENLIEMSGVSYKLTNKGIKFISKIEKNDVLDGDFDYLKSLGFRVTEGMVQDIVEEWE